MAEWNPNNLACQCTWADLFVLKQSRKPFRDSGDIEMQDFLFYNPAAGNGTLENEAKMLADELDIIFRKIDGAKYESGVTKAKAQADMVAILKQATKTMAELAEVIDEDYLFWGEKL
jgi:hypothetical protein